MRNCLFFLVFSFSLVFSNLSSVVHNFETMQQEFVLETHRLLIPGYDAFNPSIVRWKGRLLMSFRIRDPITKSTDQIGLVWLKDNFDLDSSPMILERRNEKCFDPSYAQDPRLIVVNNQLYAVYSNDYPLCGKSIRRVVLGRIENDGKKFFINQPDPILQFPEENPCRKEKNWVPFVYENHLLLSYTINPHLVFSHINGTDRCDQIANTKCSFKWDWGKLCGGTPALLIKDKYLAFFHSVKSLVSVQSEKKMMTHYFIGAYLFDSTPPFALHAVSPKPIVAKDFYVGKMYDTWKPLRVVFPGGYIYDDKYIWLMYGRQDYEIWVVKLDRSKLLNSLKNVER